MNLGDWDYMITHTTLVSPILDLKERRRMAPSHGFPFLKTSIALFDIFLIYIYNNVHMCVYMYCMYKYIYIYMCVYIFSPTARLCYGVFSPDQLRCDPVQLQHQVPDKVPEGSGADTL